MSKIKPLNDDNIFDFLQSESIGNCNNDDPISKTELPVTLDQLQPYKLNPRRTKNPLYDSILHSIETVGLDHPPRITRRSPDDEKYSIRDGGNTRLEILWQLYRRYKKLADEAENESEKHTYVEKANSFYNIKCDFYPWYDDTQALSAHMRENEARGEIKFIEKALAVKKLHELYIESDKELADLNGEILGKSSLSLRELSDRISNKGGWKVSKSHIDRFNYTSEILIDFIPNSLWAGAGEPVITKIRKLFKAYVTFWQATDHGKSKPDEINDLFYKTLSEFDGEKVDLDGFTQELDMRLEDIVNIPSVSIMAEINALMSNSKRSLKHEPDALKNRLSGQIVEGTSNEANQIPTSGRVTDSSANTVQPVKQAAKKAPDLASSESNTDERVKQKETKPPSSTESNSTAIDEVSKETTSSITGDELPSDIPSLNSLIYEQLDRIEKLTPGYLGITRMSEVYVKEGVLYDVNNFYEPKFHPYPEYGVPNDDMRTIIWWQLQKYSRDYTVNDHGQFTKLMSLALNSYIGKVQSIHPESNLVDVLLWLEHRLLFYPDILKECIRLQQLQSRIIEVSHNQSME